MKYELALLYILDVSPQKYVVACMRLHFKHDVEEGPATSLAAVAIDTSPLEAWALLPLSSTNAPPVDAAVVLPAWSESVPPSAASVDPTATVTGPADPPMALPLPTTTGPDDPAVA